MIKNKNEKKIVPTGTEKIRSCSGRHQREKLGNVAAIMKQLLINIARTYFAFIQVSLTLILEQRTNLCEIYGLNANVNSISRMQLL